MQGGSIERLGSEPFELEIVVLVVVETVFYRLRFSSKLLNCQGFGRFWVEIGLKWPSEQLSSRVKVQKLMRAKPFE